MFVIYKDIGRKKSCSTFVQIDLNKNKPASLLYKAFLTMATQDGKRN